MIDRILLTIKKYYKALKTVANIRFFHTDELII